MPALIYHNGSLGDFSIFLPSIHLWRKREKDQKITLLGKMAFGELGKACGIIDETLEAGKPQFYLIVFGNQQRRSSQFFKKV
jgi:ADP-heptose:LPS heptosyltransferase